MNNRLVKVFINNKFYRKEIRPDRFNFVEVIAAERCATTDIHANMQMKKFALPIHVMRHGNRAHLLSDEVELEDGTLYLHAGITKKEREKLKKEQSNLFLPKKKAVITPERLHNGKRNTNG